MLYERCIDRGGVFPLAWAMANGMLRLRRSLGALVALCVAAAPGVSLAAAPTHAKPAVTQGLNNADMADCHGTTAGHPAPQEDDKEQCPKCKIGVCAPDACQVKCSNVVGDLPRAYELAFSVMPGPSVPSSIRFDAIHLRPPLPPPRV